MSGLAQLMPAPNSVIKSVKKYLQQALRLDKVEPLVAYYCRLYAISQAMAIKSPKTKEDTKMIMGLMTWLEAQKATKAVPKEEAKLRCQAFALQVFSHADNEDRKAYGTAPEWKSVALSFHAAYVFMDVCKQFGGEPDKEFASRCLYAKWKTADIFKALGAGGLPKPGSFSEQNGGGGGEGGGLEAELAALDGDSDASAAAAPPKPKPAATPTPPKAATATPSPAAAAAAAAVKAPPPQVAAAPVSTSAYPAFNPSYGAPSAYTPLDDHALAPAAGSSAPMMSEADAFLSKPQVPTAAPAAASVPRRQIAAPSAPPPAMAIGGGGGGGGSAPPGSIVVHPKRMAGDTSDAVVEAEKLLRHVHSSLNFEDINTAVSKLQEALAILLPHRK